MPGIQQGRQRRPSGMEKQKSENPISHRVTEATERKPKSLKVIFLSQSSPGGIEKQIDSTGQAETTERERNMLS